MLLKILTMNKILILGDGILGTELKNQTGWDLISRKKNGFDITNPNTFNFKSYKTIINCVAYTNTYSDDKNTNWNTNYKGVSYLVDYCNENNIKLVHISSDYVYINSISEISETGIPIHGNNWYSYTKLLADAYIELKSNDYLVVRGSHKPNPFPYEKAWVDVIGNFDYIDIISGIIVKLVNLNKTGIINVGTELKSIYDLAKKTNEQILPILKPNHVPSDVSMNLDKLKTILNERNNNSSI